MKILMPLSEDEIVQLAAAWLSLRQLEPIHFAWWETNPLYLFWYQGRYLRWYTIEFSSKRFYKRFKS